MERREFLKGTAWMGAAALAGGCAGLMKLGNDGSMSNFRVAPIKRVRVGIIGLGDRGSAAVQRLARIPGLELKALCDLRPEMIAKSQKWLADNKFPKAPLEFGGKDDSWKGLSDADIDLVYITAPANLHCEMEVYSMFAGKHVLTEVPGAQTEDQAWEIIEACEKSRRHCMMLENCCYGEEELLAWNLVHQGLLGTVTHAEGGYIHNLTWRRMEDSFRNRNSHKTQGTGAGNPYPTHALGPICLYMDMNRGDRMDYLVSLSSKHATMTEYAREKFAPDAWQNQLKMTAGDMNTSIIKTALGRTIMMQYDTTTPRPYSRINFIQGSKGAFGSYPLRMAYAKTPGADACHQWFGEKQLAETREKYKHPLWKQVGEIAKKVGGHGGMDFIMDLRWAFCLQNGLPLDMDVYDLASWSSVVWASAASDRAGGKPVSLTDFTRGAWRMAKPQPIGNVDLKSMGFKDVEVKSSAQLNV